MQLVGQYVARDLEQDPELLNNTSGVGGVVIDVGEASGKQPDRVTRDAITGAVVDREERPTLQAQTITVRWEDGSESTLTEHVDSWIVLGAVAELPQVRDGANPPVGAFAELPEQRQAAEDVDVAAYFEELRAAAPLAKARAEADRAVLVEEDGAFSVVE